MAISLSIASALTGSALEGGATPPLVAIKGATLIDGTGRAPIRGAVILVGQGRIVATGLLHQVKIPKNARVIDASGKFVIPGLMDGNVHLVGEDAIRNPIRFKDEYERRISQSAQVALRSGVTTVFDTWGPAEELVRVRDRINAGADVGSRLYVGGNIIGLNGPLSADFNDKGAASLSKGDRDAINAYWERGVGRSLMYLPPTEVAAKVTAYIRRERVDFIKYASSGHKNEAFIAFSELQQRKIVEAGHEAGLKVAVHTTSPESLRIAVEAGADMAVHCTFTGDAVIAPDTIALMEKRRTVCGTALPPTGRSNTIFRSLTAWRTSGRLAAL